MAQWMPIQVQLKESVRHSGEYQMGDDIGAMRCAMGPCRPWASSASCSSGSQAQIWQRRQPNPPALRQPAQGREALHTMPHPPEGRAATGGITVCLGVQHVHYGINKAYYARLELELQSSDRHVHLWFQLP